MKLSKKIQEMAVFIEFVVSAGLAVFFHIVLNKPDAAYSIFGVGVLLSLATYLLREDLEKTRHELTDQYHQAHELTFALAQISDPECQAAGPGTPGGQQTHHQPAAAGLYPAGRE